MARRISNMNDLQKALQPVITKMVDQLAERVYETLNFFLNDYYTGWTPKSYSRTEAFLRSAVKVDAHPYNGGVKASVYIDYNSMDLCKCDRIPGSTMGKYRITRRFVCKP